MITTVKKEVVEDAKLLLETINKRKELEKLEKELKEKFKNFLGEEVAVNANGVLISLETRSRKSLDKKALSEKIDLSEFETSKEYQLMSVKQVS